MLRFESSSPNGNHLLDSLPEKQYENIAPHLKKVQLALGEVIFASNIPMRYVYFPLNCIISMICPLEEGSSAETAVIGHEGMAGTELFMGGETTPSEAIVQHEGACLRMDASIFKQEFARGGMLQQILLHYTQALMTQMAQTAVCNRHHNVDQQLCRWLLLSMDRLPSNELHVTQELIASMLGVRRESVTRVATKLQDAGLIRYRHGHITVLDRPGLEALSCECYEVARTAYDRLLPMKEKLAFLS